MSSTPLLSAATHTIRVAVGTDAHDDQAHLRDAVRRLCADAHRLRVRPEELVVLLKRTWHSQPGVSALPRHQASLVLEHIIAMCIDEYYRDALAR